MESEIDFATFILCQVKGLTDMFVHVFWDSPAFLN